MIKAMAAVLLWATAASGAAAENLPTRDTRSLVDDYAHCIVERRPNKAAEALVRNVPTPVMLREYKSLFDSVCLSPTGGGGVAVRFPGDTYRYALADALVRRELAAVPAPDLTAVPPLAYRPLPQAPAPLAPDAGRGARDQHAEAVRRLGDAVAYDFAARYAECVVRSDPAAARALLIADPATSQEKARFVALAPALQSCLTAGRTQQFTKIVLRGAMAVAYYRLANAASIVPPRP
jgi:hypothetical protein